MTRVHDKTGGLIHDDQIMINVHKIQGDIFCRPVNLGFELRIHNNLFTTQDFIFWLSGSAID